MSEIQDNWPTERVAAVIGGASAKDAAKPSVRLSMMERLGAWRAVGIFLGLYALTALLLLYRLDSHPDFAYNWENNTADGLFAFMGDPTLDIFHLHEGLMTDSGSSPIVLLPALFGFMVGGEGLGSLRWPVALLAAWAVPLLWLAGRRIVGERTALLGALLLALSPVYLLYARTATNVGISLAPMLLTVYLLLRLLERPDRWGWVIALQGALLLGGYSYAPIRFLWPMSVGLLVLEALLRKPHRKRLLAAAALTLAVLPCFIIALDYDLGHDPVVSVGYYYSGRGEQVANLLSNTQDYARSVGSASEQLPSKMELLGQVVGQNSLDLACLLLDLDTQPAITDHWNPHGRLIMWWLVPFFLMGFGRVVWLARRPAAYKYRLLLLLFLGFTLPMLLTSKVHIGRLIFALPLLCLIVAVGIHYCLLLTAYMKLRLSVGARRVVRSMVFVILLALVALSTWFDYSVEVPTTPEARITQQLIADVDKVRSEGGSVALIAVDDPRQVFETIDANQYRLGLRDYYCFRNLASRQAGPCSANDSMPTLYVGGLLFRLADPARMPHYCTNTYYVAPDLLDKFQATLRAHPDQCPESIRYRLLSH